MSEPRRNKRKQSPLSAKSREDKLREQVKELLAACKLAREVLKAKGGPTANERNHAYLTLGWAIANAEGRES